jgi:hypothetical protein
VKLNPLRAIQTRNHRNLKCISIHLNQTSNTPRPEPIWRSCKLIDLGWQDNTFNGETKEQHQATLTWELPLKFNSHGRPFLISKTLNLSLHEISRKKPG